MARGPVLQGVQGTRSESADSTALKTVQQVIKEDAVSFSAQRTCYIMNCKTHSLIITWNCMELPAILSHQASHRLEAGLEQWLSNSVASASNC